MVNDPPFRIELKPYGAALLALARERSEIVCLSGDLTRQCEVDLFRDAIPERFVHAGMAEANMMGMAAAMARSGLIPFVHTFGVFATRRPLDQIINAIAYPHLPVRIVGFMPGISSPGGPSHQAIDDVALMRSLPGMTVIDVADATETRQMVRAVVDVAGPVYIRLKRGEIPAIFPSSHQFSLDHAQEITSGTDVALFASGMMLAAALRAERTLREHGVSVSVVNVPVVKPIDAETVRRVAARCRVAVTAENHSIIGGLGSAVAEVLAESASATPLRRVGLADTYAEGAGSASYLFKKYGLSTQHLVETAWTVLGRHDRPPEAAEVPVDAGEYAPV